jgi:hypothetical protein
MIDWQRIEEFIGFGRRDASVVFIGMEEGLKEAERLDEDLEVRSRYVTAVMDLKAAHDVIAGTERYFDPDRAPRQPTWRVMANLMLRREDLPQPTGDAKSFRSAIRAALLSRSLFPHLRGRHTPLCSSPVRLDVTKAR